MNQSRTNVLIVEDSEGNVFDALRAALAGHDVEIARGAFDAIGRIEGAGRPHDVIFRDLTTVDEMPGLELWAHVALVRPDAAERMIFVASASLPARTRAFLDRLANHCLDLP